MIDVKQASKSLARLAILKFFPSDDVARTEILTLVCEMASTNEQIDWLVNRARSLWNEWEGPRELRAILSAKYKPADGIEAYSQLARFVDGIPSEKESLPALAAAPLKQLETGEPASASPSITATLSDLVRAKSLDRALKGIQAPIVREIPVVRITPENAITSADIERAVSELRRMKAAEEVLVIESPPINSPER